jgi:aminoglycoside 3-N-acetyltransferase
VCALGPLADGIVAPHPLAWGEGAGSPFDRLSRAGDGLLVLAVGFNRATLLHQAESLAPNRREKLRRIPSGDGAERRWAEAPTGATI